MHVRLKQRITYYLFLLLIVLLFGKLIFINNDCSKKDLMTEQHGKVDPWSINEHFIEKDHNKQKRNINIKNEHLNPIKMPVMQHEGKFSAKDAFRVKSVDQNQEKEWGPHQLAIIVPFRDRFEEMKEFVPHIHSYLNDKKINHKIYIINQVDTHRFNRASLVNVGVSIARKEACDYIAMHDVDLMPLNKDLNYRYPELGPFHVSGPKLHPKYHYETFVGGILIISVQQYEELNGMSNKFWGWGREDDEFYMRIVGKGYKIYRHGPEITTGYETFKHFHSKERKRDYLKLPGQKKAMFERDHLTGLHNLKYELIKRQELYIDGSPCSVLDVEIYCDQNLTPWCDMPPKKSRKSL